MRKEYNIEQLLEDFNSSKPEPSNKEKKTEINPEIDELLKETLSEFGLNLDKNRPSLQTEEEKPTPETTQEAKTTKIPENGPLAEYTKPTKKSFKFSLPPIKLYLKKVKIPAPKIIIPLVAVAIVAGSSAFYLFKPRKVNSTPTQKVTVKKPETKQQVILALPEITSLESLLGQKKETTSTELQPTNEPVQKPGQQPAETSSSPLQQLKTKEQAQNESASQPEKTPPSQKPASFNLPPEYTEPYLETAPPDLELQQLPQPEKTTDALSLQDKKVTNSFLEQYFLKEKKATDQPAPQDIVGQKAVQLGDLVPLQSVDFPPRIIRQVQPEYPSAALDIGLGGMVLVNALISEDGDVIKAVVIKGIKSEFGLNKSAANAVKQWKFRPALKDGIRVKVWKPIAIAFKKN